MLRTSTNTQEGDYHCSTISKNNLMERSIARADNRSVPDLRWLPDA